MSSIFGISKVITINQTYDGGKRIAPQRFERWFTANTEKGAIQHGPFDRSENKMNEGKVFFAIKLAMGITAYPYTAGKESIKVNDLTIGIKYILTIWIAQQRDTTANPFTVVYLESILIAQQQNTFEIQCNGEKGGTTVVQIQLSKDDKAVFASVVDLLFKRDMQDQDKDMQDQDKLTAVLILANMFRTLNKASLLTFTSQPTNNDQTTVTATVDFLALQITGTTFKPRQFKFQVPNAVVEKCFVDEHGQLSVRTDILNLQLMAVAGKVQTTYQEATKAAEATTTVVAAQQSVVRADLSGTQPANAKQLLSDEQKKQLAKRNIAIVATCPTEPAEIGDALMQSDSSIVNFINGLHTILASRLHVKSMQIISESRKYKLYVVLGDSSDSDGTDAKACLAYILKKYSAKDCQTQVAITIAQYDNDNSTITTLKQLANKLTAVHRTVAVATETRSNATCQSNTTSSQP